MQSELVRNSWHWRYSAAELKSVDLIANQVEAICQQCTVDSARPRLHMVLGELMMNAIDHGLLQLDSDIKSEPGGFDRYQAERLLRLERLMVGTVRVTADKENDKLLRIAIQDSGKGFDYKQVLSGQPEIDCLHGRGLLIARHLCESMKYVGCGNCVVVEFSISN
ncbi:hypothetical protein AB833_32405 [Chromatiales bacterium (ex Bugula neritina AB1)]|nr:hypothetical protein AB833_32405 [Chromatiales bacterium (ex Bugula neritina AB1)]